MRMHGMEYSLGLTRESTGSTGSAFGGSKCLNAVTYCTYGSGKNNSSTNFHPTTGNESPEGKQKYNTLSLTSALEMRGWSTPQPGSFVPGKQRRYA
jgi:hypothetical protein